MLGKLVKYDFKSVSKVMGLLAAITGGYALLCAIMLQTPVYADLFSGNNDSAMVAFGGITGLFGFIALFLIIAGVNAASVIYLGVRFFKSMYDDEGYLTHTLPATGWERLGAKLITASVWVFIIRLTIVVSCGLIVISFIIIAARNGVDVSEALNDIKNTIVNDIFPYKEYAELFVKATVHAVIYGIFYLFLSPFIEVAHVFGALSIGQCFKKNRGFIGVVVYFAISWGTNLVLTIIRGIIQASEFKRLTTLDADGISGYMTRTIFLNYDLQLVVTLAVSIVLVYVAHHIIEDKLNLI